MKPILLRYLFIVSSGNLDLSDHTYNVMLNVAITQDKLTEYADIMCHMSIFVKR